MTAPPVGELPHPYQLFQSNHQCGEGRGRSLTKPRWIKSQHLLGRTVSVHTLTAHGFFYKPASEDGLLQITPGPLIPSTSRSTSTSTRHQVRFWLGRVPYWTKCSIRGVCLAEALPMCGLSQRSHYTISGGSPSATHELFMYQMNGSS